MGSAGPVSKVQLWKELLQHLDSTFQDILWIKIPSHVNVEGNEQADTLANNGRLSNPLYPTRKTPKVHPARQRVKRTCQVDARRSPSREVSPPRPTVLNFEQCVDSQRAREDTPDIFPVDDAVRDVLQDLGLIEMPDSPRSVESTHNQHSSASTVTVFSDMSEAPAAAFGMSTDYAGYGRRSPSTSFREREFSGPLTAIPAPAVVLDRDWNRSPSTSCIERDFS